MNKQDYIDALKALDDGVYEYYTDGISSDVDAEDVLGIGNVEAIKQALQGKIDGGWQPIETAPKDGTPIVIYNGVITTARFVKDEWEAKWNLLECGEHCCNGNAETPTHWMPLPNPPKEEGSE